VSSISQCYDIGSLILAVTLLGVGSIKKKKKAGDSLIRIFEENPKH